MENYACAYAYACEVKAVFVHESETEDSREKERRFFVFLSLLSRVGDILGNPGADSGGKGKPSLSAPGSPSMFLCVRP